MGLTQKLGTIPLAILTDSSNNVGIGAAANASFKLQVTGATNLTGALSGTSATFSTSGLPLTLSTSAGRTDQLVLTQGASTQKSHIGNFAGNTYLSTNWFFTGSGAFDDNTLKSSSIVLNGDGSINLNTNNVVNTNPTTALALSATGAATFSSSVTATTSIIATSADTLGTNVNIVNTSSGGYNWNIFSGGSSNTLAPAGSLIFRDSTNGATRMIITTGGQIVMGRTTGSGGRLTVDGDLYLHNISAGAGQSTLKYNYTSTGLVTYDTSSRLLKKDIENLGYGLDDVLKMSAKKYKWKKDDSIDLGFIADEMVKIIPEIVFFSTEMTNETTGVPIGEPLSINYDRLIPVLVKAIQELEARIKQLENK
jgi:hypothetical protein